MNRRKFAAFAGLTSVATRLADRFRAPARKPFVVLPDSARVYDTGLGETRILVASEQSGGAWWLGSFAWNAGRKTSLHVHFSAEEQIYVLEGTLSVWLDDRWEDLPAGALAVAPARVPHALGNRTNQTVRFLVSGERKGRGCAPPNRGGTRRTFGRRA